MTRKVWAAIVCLVVLVVTIVGFVVDSDIYDTRHPTYDFVGKIAPKADMDRAKAYGQLMRRQDLAGLRQASRSDILNADFYHAVPVIAGYYPKGEPIATGPVSYTRKVMSDGTNLSVVVILFRYSDGSVIVTTTTTDANTGKVVGFNLHKLTADDLKRICFDPAAANGAQAFMLFVAAAVFLFTLGTAYACLANPALKWKWLWFFFIMAGIGSLRFNWLTQAVQFVPIDIRWGASGYFQPLFEPTTIYINLPMGAAIYWLTRRRKTRPVVQVASASSL